MKIKLAMARHLLDRAVATFIESGNLGSRRTDFTERGVMWQVLIQFTFVASAIGIAFVDKLSDSGMRKQVE